MGLGRITIYLQYIPYITGQERSIRIILLLPCSYYFNSGKLVNGNTSPSFQWDQINGIQIAYELEN